MVKDKEALNGPDDKAWKHEVEKEYKQMMKHKVWTQVKKSQVQKEGKISGSVWSIMKKAERTWWDSLMAHGCCQNNRITKTFLQFMLP